MTHFNWFVLVDMLERPVMARLLLSSEYCLGGVSYLASLQLQGDPSEANQPESVASSRLVQSARPKKMQVILFMKQNRASEKTFLSPWFCW